MVQSITRAAKQEVGKNLNKKHPNFSDLRMTLIPEDIRTVLVQMQALGFILRSPQKVLGELIWALTPYGQEKLVQLYAVRSESVQEVKSIGTESI